jgi:hypothetical protein
VSISDKTRKILWGRCGNRCAICKIELVLDSTKQDNESIIADECHIISPSPNGPRHDNSYPVDKLNTYDNLLLLCRTHHKMIDDQYATYTTNILRQIKSEHEQWVSQKLTTNRHPKPLKIRRAKQNIPDFLYRLTTGKEVFDLVSNAMAYSFDHEELKSQDEVELIGAFLQAVQDWGDLSADLEVGDLTQAAYNLTKLLQILEESGFFVFGAKEVQILEGGCELGPSNWPVAILKILRKGNCQIIKFDFNNIEKEKS